jgi:glycosyltransferase involved in cell wall biosynthesis
MNILLLTAHDIAEYDDLRMLTDLGANVFSIGAYTDPTQGSAMRPPLDVPSYPDLAQRCVEQREKHAGEPMQTLAFGQIHNIVDWAKADLHDDIIEWADVIICHHYLESWIARQWSRIRHKRVIWRTCGQSNPQLENVMSVLRRDGLEIIRYSPKEEYAFGKLGVFAGADAMIRFGKYPEDYGPWTGEDAVVGNVTQNMIERGVHCGLPFYLAATEGLPAKPAGPNSQLLPGGIGALSYDEMREYLRRCRAYVYTGTQPASYTLGLIEALMTGVPTISMSPKTWWEPDLFEGHELAPWMADSPQAAHAWLEATLAAPVDVPRDNGATPLRESAQIRKQAIEVFGIENIAPQWAAFLGLPVRQLVAA